MTAGPEDRIQSCHGSYKVKRNVSGRRDCSGEPYSRACKFCRQISGGALSFTCIGQTANSTAKANDLDRVSPLPTARETEFAVLVLSTYFLNDQCSRGI